MSFILPRHELTSFFGLILFLCAVSPIRAQRPKLASDAAIAEKIYLQTDSEIYINEQVIWLKLFVVEAATNRPTKLSGVLYAELIDANGNIMDEKLVKIENGTGNSFFELTNQYLPGRYMLRAYTAWNRNFGDTFISRKYIDIYSSEEEKRLTPIQNTVVTEESKANYLLSAEFLPQRIDSLHSKKLDVFINLGEDTDSLSIKSQDGHVYSFQYPITAVHHLATLGMRTINGRYYSKTIALHPSLPEVTFYPESGHLVHGILNRVVFKATDVKGNGLNITGAITDNDGNFICDITGTHLGLGTFMLRPDSSKTYHAAINAVTDSTETHTFNLPKVKSNGNTLNVNTFKNQIRLSAYSFPATQDSAYIKVSCRGVNYFLLKGPMANGQMAAAIAADQLPNGVIAFTLLDSDRRPVAQRLFFNKTGRDEVNIEIKADSITYHPRSKMAISVKVSDSTGNPAPAQIAVKVVNKQLYGPLQEKNTNIESFFLLESDFDGGIKQPGYYLSPQHPTRLQELDMLMMTKNRTYRYGIKEHQLTIPPEPSLKVAGTVSSAFSKKKKKEGIDLTLMAFGEEASLLKQQTDSLGRFHFNLPDHFGQHINVLLQTANANGKKRNYTVQLDRKEVPTVHFDQREAISIVDSVKHLLVKKQQEKHTVDEAFRLTGDYMELEEVTVEDYLLTPQRQKVMDRFGKPDDVIDGEEIEAREQKWSYGLYSVLLFNYPEKVRIERVGGAGGYLWAEVNNSEMTLVVVDGIPVMNYNYDLIPNIPPSEVKSVELIEYANNFSRLFMEVYPQASPLEAPMTGNVIAIYTYAGKGVFSVDKPDGILKASVPIFSPKRNFEAPDYSKLTPQERIKPDLRTLIHWDPALTTDGKGKTLINYYNADIPGEMLIIIEAITEDGKTGYQKFTYQVKE
ncbi:hypothetical protein [Echinicola rosea]|uniref:Uncharacterized protein n=1 Tax=Echinicola rosea TaxID=1807691 RepID=A0ABQ1VAA8_9BACT|nr:hypothetical protein [Echinicola rosea]GGF48555.1 hypothetical protein GCM10011339_41460 [Echinicola rosea]